jgi:uncharacterized protein (DUF1330 family)
MDWGHMLFKPAESTHRCTSRYVGGDFLDGLAEYVSLQTAFSERQMPALPKLLNESLVRNLPDRGPVVMVNLLRIRPRSLDGNGTGWDAYTRYSRATMKLIKARGGTVLWGGNGESVAFGDAAKDRWDYVVLVQYPSRAAFLDMITSADYEVANIHRENGVQEHVILAMAETYSKFAG